MSETLHPDNRRPASRRQLCVALDTARARRRARCQGKGLRARVVAGMELAGGDFSARETFSKLGRVAEAPVYGRQSVAVPRDEALGLDMGSRTVRGSCPPGPHERQAAPAGTRGLSSIAPKCTAVRWPITQKSPARGCSTNSSQPARARTSPLPARARPSRATRSGVPSRAAPPGARAPCATPSCP